MPVDVALYGDMSSLVWMTLELHDYRGIHFFSGLLQLGKTSPGTISHLKIFPYRAKNICVLQNSA
jgi:hypothetical protein